MVRGGPLDLTREGPVHAVLGPTNTGKTHVAIRRMLGHRSGMIGLPLRLLAREVYDRVCAEVGTDAVALVTGEEKIVPAGARYWVCTTESMPVDRPVAFLAVDEIQLCTDPGRGHVFTDRLLHARGVAETWFLGSDTVTALIQGLVPGVQVRSQPRLSRLTYAGRRKLVALPPRSAVVAYSIARVYELAERLRSRHGGAAVVLGALSPRTRNAQVELFQSGDVQHLVATDAIGMGLNMDVHHVALAGLHKFDGRHRRALRPDELAQVAGRAGRWKRDGTFGETGGAPSLDPDVVVAIEAHAFAPRTHAVWRSRDLDLSSVDALRASLAVPPTRPGLVPAPQADDARALDALGARAEVIARATTPDRVALLWAVCGVPDFGNVRPEQHATLLAQLYVQLVDHDGRLPEDWLARQVDRVARTEGDIAQLTARVAAIRIWTFVAHQVGWTADPAHWQDRTRAIEDRVSDALHAQLTARFVDRRATAVARHTVGPSGPPRLDDDGALVVGGEAVGHVHGLGFALAPGAPPSAPLRKALRALVEPVIAGRLDEAVAATDEAFAVDDDGVVRWQGAPIARLQRGDGWRTPVLRLVRQDDLDADQRHRLAARVEAWFRAWIDAPWAPVHALDVRAPAARGLAHALVQGPGAVSRREVGDQLRALPRAARSAMVRQGVRFGQAFVLHPEVVADVRPRWVRWRVAHGAAPALPDDGGARPFQAGWSRDAAAALGFVGVGGWMVRIDTLEGVIAGGEGLAGVPGAAVDAVRRAYGRR